MDQAGCPASTGGNDHASAIYAQGRQPLPNADHASAIFGQGQQDNDDETTSEDQHSDWVPEQSAGESLKDYEEELDDENDNNVLINTCLLMDYSMHDSEYPSIYF